MRKNENKFQLKKVENVYCTNKKKKKIHYNWKKKMVIFYQLKLLVTIQPQKYSVQNADDNGFVVFLAHFGLLEELRIN